MEMNILEYVRSLSNKLSMASLSLTPLPAYLQEQVAEVTSSLDEFKRCYDAMEYADEKLQESNQELNEARLEHISLRIEQLGNEVKHWCGLNNRQQDNL